MASSSLDTELKNWLEELHKSGWLGDSQFQRFQALLSRGPVLLERPLLVAFFGGTGVGKSTLLNRLAGGEVAEVSPLRPTSREVTLYLHRDLDLTLLPLREGKVVRHTLPKFRQIVWIDTPDINSVERQNRDKALRWLPHVDIVVYVVDPERYRDDRGWRLLLQHGGRCGWLFVMGHWDSGHELQIEDFRKLLKEAGFDDPLVLRCDSRPEIDRRKPDDFAKLEAILQEVASFKGQEVIVRKRQALRQQEIAALLEEIPFGDPGQWQALQTKWQAIFEELRRELSPIIETFSQAATFPLLDLARERWFLEPLEDALDRLLLEASFLPLPSELLQKRLGEFRKNLAPRLGRTAQQTVAEAMRHPGGKVRDFTYRTFEKLRYALPLLAGSWVAYQVVVKYYQGFFEEENYLGDEFALHSTMLLLIAWLIPELFYRLLRPSTEKRFREGIRTGLIQALETLREEIEACISELEQEARQLKRRCQAFQGKLRQKPHETISIPYLDRMIPRHVPAV